MTERRNEMMNNEVMENTTNVPQGAFTAIQYGSTTWPLPEQEGGWEIEDIVLAAIQLSSNLQHPITNATPYTISDEGIVTFVKPTQSAGTKGNVNVIVEYNTKKTTFVKKVFTKIVNLCKKFLG